MNKKETVILARMEIRSKMMFEKIEKIEKKLLGNGADGLCITVDRHDQTLKSYSKGFWILGVGLVFLVLEKVLGVFLP